MWAETTTGPTAFHKKCWSELFYLMRLEVCGFRTVAVHLVVSLLMRLCGKLRTAQLWLRTASCRHSARKQYPARITGKLDQGLRRGAKLTLISAPASFGKTAVLSEWIASSRVSSSDLRVAWLSFKHVDNDPARFRSHLTSATGARHHGPRSPH